MRSRVEVRQRLHLELDDAAAAQEVTAQVEQNATAMLPVIFDKLHQACDEYNMNRSYCGLVDSVRIEVFVASLRCREGPSCRGRAILALT